MLIDRIAEACGARLSRFGDLVLTGRVTLAGQEVLLLKPQTYMNLSGRAVRQVLDYFALDSNRCLVIFDDIALPLGKIRLRGRGSAGGHKGMQSVIDELGTQEVPRLRIGIAAGSGFPDLADYVLSRFSPEEKVALEETLSRSEDAVTCFLREGIDGAMAAFN